MRHISPSRAVRCAGAVARCHRTGLRLAATTTQPQGSGCRALVLPGDEIRKHVGHQCLAILFATIVLACLGVFTFDRRATRSSSQNLPRSQSKDPPLSSNAQSTTPIPPDVIYTILKEHTIPGIKRGFGVRLNRKVSKEVLRSIAIELKNLDPNTYEPTFPR